MPLFPMFIDLNQADVLIIGQGHHALDKAEKLTPFGPRIQMIPPERFDPALLCPRPALVILAQPGHPDNPQIFSLCHEAGIPVNTVDDPKLCTVRFPSLVTRGELSVGISTGGKSPVAASLIRESIEQTLPGEMEDILTWAGGVTARLRREIPDYALRAARLRRIITRALELNRPLTEEETASVL